MAENPNENPTGKPQPEITLSGLPRLDPRHRLVVEAALIRMIPQLFTEDAEDLLTNARTIFEKRRKQMWDSFKEKN
ncbi:MAG: hypothetical protein JXB13_01890 [Phycisphaerae bacterium]|nr:hypothetical protein [Phycisphaerae bacterium]